MDIYKQDRFYVANREVIWMYYNYDAGYADQFVRNCFDKTLLNEALQTCGDNVNAVFDYIGGECKQYCADIGTYCYDDEKLLFESEPFAIGTTKETLDKIIKALEV